MVTVAASLDWLLLAVLLSCTWRFTTKLITTIVPLSGINRCMTLLCMMLTPYGSGTHRARVEALQLVEEHRKRASSSRAAQDQVGALATEFQAVWTAAEAAAQCSYKAVSQASTEIKAQAMKTAEQLHADQWQLLEKDEEFNKLERAAQHAHIGALTSAAAKKSNRRSLVTRVSGRYHLKIKQSDAGVFLLCVCHGRSNGR